MQRRKSQEAERASGGLYLDPVVPEAPSISAHCTDACHEPRDPTSSHAGSSQLTVPYHKGPDKYQEEVSFCAGWGGIQTPYVSLLCVLCVSPSLHPEHEALEDVCTQSVSSGSAGTNQCCYLDNIRVI